MQRSMSASSVSGQAAHEAAAAPAAIPPWERREVAQVPFIRTNSPPLTENERAALPSFWASQSSAPQPPLQGEHVRAGKSTNYGPSPVSPAKDGRNWPDNQPAFKAPLTAGLPPEAPMPYESVRIPHAPKTAPALPSFVCAPSSPTQSLNLSRSSTTSQKSKAGSVSPPPTTTASEPPALPALPGTMSRRDRTTTTSRIPGSRRDKGSHAKTSSADMKPFGQRFKTGLRNMFKRDPIDETQFERIGDRHWTDS